MPEPLEAGRRDTTDPGDSPTVMARPGSSAISSHLLTLGLELQTRLGYRLAVQHLAKLNVTTIDPSDTCGLARMRDLQRAILAFEASWVTRTITAERETTQTA